MSDEELTEGITFDTVCHCAKLFQKVLEYKPSSKVIPKDTVLAIVMYTRHGYSLYNSMRYHNKKKDKVIEEFTSIERIVLVPRPVDGFMSYCISGLAMRMHGTIHLGLEQERWFKEAASHIEVHLLKEGANFENERWGIKVV